MADNVEKYNRISPNKTKETKSDRVDTVEIFSKSSNESLTMKNKNQKRYFGYTGDVAEVIRSQEAQLIPKISSSQLAEDAKVVDADSFCIICLRDKPVT